MKRNSLLYILTTMLLASCSMTKDIPDGEQLFTGLTKITYENYEDRTSEDNGKWNDDYTGFTAGQIEIKKIIYKKLI